MKGTVRIKVVLVAGLALTAIAVFIALLHSPSVVIAENGVQAGAPLAYAKSDASACQRGETLPAGTSSIRLALEATTGPRTSVEALEGPRVITQGTVGTAWYGSAVTIPVRPVRRTHPHVTVCFQMVYVNGYVALFGVPTPPALAAITGGKPMQGRLRITYLRPSRRSWLSLAGTVIRHMGLGRAASGTWIVLPIAALATAVIALAAWLAARELR